MKLAKAQIDFGLCTNNIDALLSFWQTDVGLQLDHVLPVRRGQTQHRHDALGSVIKINHIVKGLPQTTPSGYRELLIARPNLAHPQRLTDPDGNRVTLLPRGNEGVNQIGIRLTVRNLDAHRAFLYECPRAGRTANVRRRCFPCRRDAPNFEGAT